ncbi:transposase [Paraburkholderia sp. JPY681]|nr:IS66 family transposase [Paraburkholderia atlantica]MBB5510873.1 transposase [Paraburkholderia atlantica]
MSNGADLPDDVELLEALLVEARSLLAERDVEVDEQLKAQIDKLRRMQFGRKSERLQRQIETLETQLEDLAAGRGVVDVQRAQARSANASTSNATTDEAASRQALPTHLPREDHVRKPESSCPHCGQPMQVLGEDESEQLARVAAAFKVNRTIRRKLVCPCCSTITQPPMPGLPIERSIAHPSLLADILVSKYADHQPLYRQSAIAAHDGATIDPRASMGRWIGQCEALCAPLTEALRRYTMAATKLHANDTPIPVLSMGNRKTRTRRLWVYVRDDHRSGSTQPASVWFAYSPNRQGMHPQTHLADFKGILQADAYAGFDELFRDGSIREAACHAHARRKFYDILVRTPSDTTQKALEYIGGLYDIEASIGGRPAAERLRIRRRKPDHCFRSMKRSSGQSLKRCRRSPIRPRRSTTR